MRKLWPFVGIALAVALGIAVAPYLWWILGGAGLIAGGLLALGVLNLAWRAIRARSARAWQWLLDQGVDPPDV